MEAPLPSNLSRDKIVEIRAKVRRLQSDPKVSQDDPEIIESLRILRAVKLFKQHHDAREQFRQRKRHSSSSLTTGHAPPNGYHSISPSQANGITNGHDGGESANGLAQQRKHDGTRYPEGDEKSNSAFSTKHKSRLGYMVQAFQALSRNAPVPARIQREIFPSQQAALAERSSFEKYQTVYDLDKLKNAPNYVQHEYQQRRPIVPAALGSIIDESRAREERQNIVFNRISQRINELENLSVNVDSWDTSKGDTPELDGSLKRKALIELKSLRLLGKQRKLREAIKSEMIQANTLAMTVDRAKLRRMKKHDIREARFTEKFEKEQRNAREQKEKKRHGDFLQSVFEHAKDVKQASLEQRTRISRLGRLVAEQHKVIEKEEQKRVERTARQRLQALKANDEETYLKLLGQAKDSRISHLLKQTDNFLNQLAASVKSQQRSVAERWGTHDITASDESESEMDEENEEGTSGRVDYYEIAHRIKEEIGVQSSNLVGGTLKEYQLKGLQWMISLYNNNLNGILADEMGLGKTIQTISLITYLIEKKGQNGPYLVIVPLSTLTNWNNEFEKWAPSVKRIVYKGPPNSRKQAQQFIRHGQFQVLLTTYEFIIKDRPVLSKVKWLHMIVDEGHRMKNQNSKLSSTITQYYTTRYRLILTGTPLQNNLPELWALLNFVLPNIFNSVKSFDEWFNTPFANTGGQDKMDLSEEEQILVIRRLHKVLRPFLLRRLKTDVEKDLPEKQERVIKCTFSALQSRLYRQLMTHNRLTVRDSKGGKTGLRGLSNMLMQLRKLCNHPFVFEEVEEALNPDKVSNDLLWRTAGKFELLDRILPKFLATGHRCLIFFQMTQIMNIMEDFMRLRGFKYLRLDGSTKADDRADLLKEFNAEGSEYFCFLLSTRAGGLGLNLQSADTVIIFDSDWNPHQDLQAQDRAHRIGQKNEVRILRLITSASVEEKILERAQFKLDMDGKVIQAGKFDNKSTNEERDAMLRVMLESAEAAESLENEEMDDDDLNLLMMRSEDELGVFQKLDAERAADPLYGHGKKYSRLLQDNELPDIYLNDDNPTTEDLEEVLTGRGARERTRVKYDDGLTEEQWLEAIDDDNDTIEAAVARKEARIAKRAANKDRRGGRVENVVESPTVSRESSASPAPKKRGRKPTAKNKRNADEASLDSESVVAPPSKKRGRQNKPTETLGSEQREALQAILEKVHQDIQDLRVKDFETPAGTYDAIDAFVQLPDKKLYPDYYKLIERPICIDQMVEKINGAWYQSLDEYYADIKLMCENCRFYNDEQSLLYRDANTIESLVLSKLRAETTSNPELGKAGFSDKGSQTPMNGANGASSGGTNGGDGSGMKLKLNMGGASA